MSAPLIVLAVILIGLSIAHYEKKEVIIEKAVLISLLSSLSTVGRILFGPIPSVQPSSFLIILAGVCFGPEIGLMTGLITAMASNLVLGQGPWTLWQMLCWGGMGLLSGLLSGFLRKYKTIRVLYGFVWGFVFGWIMNLWYLTGYSAENSVSLYLTSCVSSFYFDLAHGLSTSVLLAVAGEGMVAALHRMGKKYGLIHAS